MTRRLNILLALQERSRTGCGRALDIAMTDNLFTFMYWAMGNGLGAGQWPGNGTGLVCGGTPRYRLYATQDGKAVAAAPIEQKFWEEFCAVIGLDDDLQDDSRDRARTTARIAAIIVGAPSEVWRQRFAERDCCCSVVSDVKEAVNDPHFRARGLFDYRLVNDLGASIPALPVPVIPAFRGDKSLALSAPALGADNPGHVG